ncbi:lachesin-like [Sitophilus oryzae]|uniref:Lachesin-like n=1 Tax=Sitophilus oryzae TaxID=7048 RepID=A0A6J2YDG4_SITOR|nr:lachesin-like [Sitophilus oryzae]
MHGRESKYAYTMRHLNSRARHSVVIVIVTIRESAHVHLESPSFSAPITNVTAAVGREAILTCLVQDLGNFKVAWLRVDTQTILTIHNHVITKNHRIGVTHSEHKTWFLHIREIKATDKGWYMCQINTDPMKSQVGYLDVVVPPDILDYATSTDVVIREGSNVNLHCVAKGFPTPSIMWKRETGEMIKLDFAGAEGSVLNLTRVSRQQMGPYLCIASNGVPPSVSKRIMLIVHFPPMVWIKNQLVGAYEGQQVTLECHLEAFPKSINYWINERGEIISQSSEYDPTQKSHNYKIYMKLKIEHVMQSDYGKYKCIAKNALGETDGTIQLFCKYTKAGFRDLPGSKGIDDSLFL